LLIVYPYTLAASSSTPATTRLRCTGVGMARPWRSDGASRVKLADVDIKCTAFNADGSVLGIGLESGEVQLCAWPSLQVTATLGKHSDAVTAGGRTAPGRSL